MLTLFCIFIGALCALFAVLGRLDDGIYANSVYISYLADRGVCIACEVCVVLAVVVLVCSSGSGRMGGV